MFCNMTINASVIVEYSNPDLPHMQIIQVRNEDHTLGNLLVNILTFVLRIQSFDELYQFEQHDQAAYCNHEENRG